MNSLYLLLLFNGDGDAAQPYAGPFRVAAAQFCVPGSVKADSYVPGAEASQLYVAGSQKGDYQ